MSDTSLSELRDYVWTYTDLDSEELPPTLLDRFAVEASRRIRRRRKRWSFFESTWTFSTVVGQAEYPLADMSSSGDYELDDLVEVQDSDGNRLYLTTRDKAAQAWSTDTSEGTPQWCHVWGDTLVLHPTPSEVDTFTLYGYRKPTDWVATTQVPDFPEDFDSFFELFMLGRAYQQQEDPDMGLMYLDQAELILTDCLTRYPEHDGPSVFVIGGDAVRRAPMNLTLLDNWVT